MRSSVTLHFRKIRNCKGLEASLPGFDIATSGFIYADLSLKLVINTPAVLFLIEITLFSWVGDSNFFPCFPCATLNHKPTYSYIPFILGRAYFLSCFCIFMSDPNFNWPDIPSTTAHFLRLITKYYIQICSSYTIFPTNSKFS